MEEMFRSLSRSRSTSPPGDICPRGSAAPRRGQPGDRQVRRSSPRHRNWVFTLNNYTERERLILNEYASSERVSFCVYQPEVGASGTPHLQGLFILRQALCLNTIRQHLGVRSIHLEPMRGTLEEAEAYCTKEDTRDATASFGPTHIGTRPAAGTGQQGSRTDLGRLWNGIKGGLRGVELIDAFPSEFMRFTSGISKCIQSLEPPRSWKTEIYWLWGPTGSGKSRFANETAPEAYWKMPTNKWWDDYCGQEDVIIDDFRRDFCTFAELLRMFDRYPFRVEVKGGSTQFRAKRIFLTSPLDVRHTWEGQTEENLLQLERRVEHVIQFPQLGNIL